MSDSDDEARVAQTKDEEKAEGFRYMARDWFRIAVVATAGTIVVALGLLQLSGLIDLYPLADEGMGQWLVYGALVVAAVVFGVWAWEYFGEAS